MLQILKYLKPNQEYFDQYDRSTISILKSLTSNPAQEVPKEFQRFADSMARIAFLRQKHRYWEMRTETIEAWKNRDRKLDQLVNSSKPIDGIRCNTCKSWMVSDSHFLMEENTKVLFLYSCPNGHAPRRAFYPDGTEHTFTVRTCPVCDSTLETTKGKTKETIEIQTKCSSCNYSTTDVYDIGEDTPKKITTKQRELYCIMSQSELKFLRDFEEDVKRLSDLYLYLKEEEDAEKEIENLNLDKIQHLKIPHLESLLIEALEEKGYIRFELDKPKISTYLTIEFSAQDPTLRDDNDSINQLSIEINSSLFESNWRLIQDSVKYRLGYISGKLRAYEAPEDLIIIGREIAEKRK